MNFKKLSDLMDHFTSWRIPGCSCVVYYKHEPVFKYSSGYADVENGIKMDADYHKLFAYSASKLITCTCAMMLWEEGKFALDNLLCDYIPEWADLKYTHRPAENETEIRKCEKNITIGDLFSMTSGLDYNVGGKSFTAALEKFKPECRTVDMIKALAGDPLYQEPGKGWFYGMSHDVIGALIEVISGKTLRDFAKERIFDPLGLKDTAYAGRGEIGDRAAVQYWFNDEKDHFERASQENGFLFGTEYCSGGAGVVSTVPEMAKFAELLCNGGKTPDGASLISKDTIDLMRKNRLGPGQDKDYWLPGYGYGLGVRTLIDKEKADAKSPIGEFGWTGAAGAYVLIDPDTEVCLYYAHHMLNNQEWYTAPRLRNTLYECIEQ